MNKKRTPNISKSLEEPHNIVNTTGTSSRQPEEDGQSTGKATNNDSTKDVHLDAIRIQKDPMFVIVDSSCASNPSSREMVINNIAQPRDEMVRRYNRNVLPIDVPSTSKGINEILHSPFTESDSGEELQVIEINLQSENELPIQNDEEDKDSIVIAYLKNRDKFDDRDGLLVSTKKKSSLLDDVPKMETILEDEQFASFVISQNISSSSVSLKKKISEHSLDLHIPSYPGSPRSLDIASGHSYESEYFQNPNLREAIEFLHADKDLLIAAETGNDQLLEIILRRTDTNIQEMDHLGRNALHLAVCSGNIRAVEMLLKAGVNPNVKDSVGMTPLSLCLMRSPSLAVAQLLFDYGAKILPRSNPMDTGLFIQFVMMSAPTEEEAKILRLLVAKGALINDPEAPGGRQTLHFAAMSNNCPLIRILVDLGAYLHLTNHRNETPRQVAATFDCADAYELLTELEDIELNSPSSHFFRCI